MPWWIVAGVVIVVVATAWLLPKWQVNRLRLGIPDAKARRADVEDNFRKTIGQLLGGAAVLSGAWVAYNQTQLTSQASRDQVISQQVSKGFEQLGSDTTKPLRLTNPKIDAASLACPANRTKAG